MNQPATQSEDDLLFEINQTFNHDLALQVDYLRQENKILRSKLGKRVHLTNNDRHVLVQYGLPTYQENLKNSDILYLQPQS